MSNRCGSGRRVGGVRLGAVACGAARGVCEKRPDDAVVRRCDGGPCSACRGVAVLHERSEQQAARLASEQQLAVEAEASVRCEENEGRTASVNLPSQHAARGRGWPEFQPERGPPAHETGPYREGSVLQHRPDPLFRSCLLYTSDAADE